MLKFVVSCVLSAQFKTRLSAQVKECLSAQLMES